MNHLFAWVAALFACVQVLGEVLAAEPGFTPVLSGSERMLGMRMLTPGLVEGRFALAQVRVAELVAGPVADSGGGVPGAGGAVAARWRLKEESTYAVNCHADPKQVGLVQRAHNIQPDERLTPNWQQLLESVPTARLNDLSMQPLEQGEAPLADNRPEDPSRVGAVAVRSPPELQSIAVFACAVASSHWAEVDAAKHVQQTAGLAEVVEFNCELHHRSTGAIRSMSLAYLAFPPVVRVGDKWLSDGWLTPEYIAVADAGLDIRLMRATGKLRVVSRAEAASVASGDCVRATHSIQPITRKYKTGW